MLYILFLITDLSYLDPPNVVHQLKAADAKNLVLEGYISDAQMLITQRLLITNVFIISPILRNLS
jgi:hypothetical protein